LTLVRSSDNQGLFGGTNNAVIQNLTLYNVSINITGEHSNCGGLVGCNSSSEINNCHITGIVKGDNNVGGLVGNNINSTISNCSFTGEVSEFSPSSYTSHCMGGLVGQQTSSSVLEKSSVSANIYGEWYAGGIVGKNDNSDIPNNLNEIKLKTQRPKRTCNGTTKSGGLSIR